MSSECPICAEFYSDTRRIKVTPCGHSLCSLCVQKLSGRDSDCPFCKKEIFAEEWLELPDNYAMMDMPTGEEALKAIALSTASHLISNLELEAKQLESSLSDLRRAESETKKRRHDLSQLPFPAFSPVLHLRAINDFLAQIETETEEIAERGDERGPPPSEIQKILANNKVIYDRLTVLSEELIRAPEQALEPCPSSGDPVVHKLRMLQEESNAKQRRLQGYYSCLAEVDTLANRLSAAKQEALDLFKSERSVYEVAEERLAEEMRSATVQNLKAQKCIEKLQLDIAALEASRESMDLEKSDLINCIEMETKQRLLEINTDLRQMDELTKGLATGWKDRGVSLEESLSEYRKFLVEETNSKQNEIARTEGRLAAFRGKLKDATEMTVLDEDITALTDENRKLGDILAEQAAVVMQLREKKLESELHLKNASSQVASLEAAIERHRFEGKSATSRTAATQSAQCQLKSTLEPAILRVSDLKLCKATLLEKIRAVESRIQTSVATLETAARYVSDVLEPAKERVESELAAFARKFEVANLRYEDDIAHLQLVYSRLIARSIENAGIANPPAGLSPRPAPEIRPKSNENQVFAARLRADRDRLVSVCNEISEKLLAKSVKKLKLSVVEKPKVDQKYSLLCGVGAYFVFLWVRSVLGNLV